MTRLLNRFRRSPPQQACSTPVDRPGNIADPNPEAAYQLCQFDDRLAPVLLRWVDSPRVLRWLAPSVERALTPDMVLEWRRKGGRPLCLVRHPGPTLLAYGELNPMRHQPGHYWLGHILVDPVKRGKGIGTRFIRAMERYAFRSMGALQLSLVVFPDNRSAIACYGRAGFRSVGEEHHRFLPSGPMHCLLRMTLMRSEWESLEDRHSA
ncbi:MAG: GNAT family N-acetyltransferase [Phycisphaerae bacterium]|nr:GNAT family N-acetyltransferase [Phycisphaerae bacterium]